MVSRKVINMIEALLGLAVAISVLGCGGNSANVSSLTRGEGDIPVGRLKSPHLEESEVVIHGSDDHLYHATVDPYGVISVSTLPSGPANVIVNSLEPDVEQVVVPLQIGSNESYIMNIESATKRPGAVVTGMTIELMGQTPIRMGQVNPVKVTVSGLNVNGLKPTIWIDGGNGFLDAGNRFSATATGPATVCAKLLGVTVRLDFTVQ